MASPAYYIGCLGSHRTHAKRLDRLRVAGFDDSALERLHAPVGLDIGGCSSGEIAVSILAEIIVVGNGRKHQPTFSKSSGVSMSDSPPAKGKVTTSPA